MGFVSLDIQVEEEEEHGVIMDHEGFKNSNFSVSDDDDDEVSSIGSVDSCDDMSNNSSSEVNSSLSSSPNSPFSYSNNSSSPSGAALNDMSSLLKQLPIKRGLSKHFDGKSQSFTCLSNVRCLEDLAKPENPYSKKLKSCKSYVGLHGGGCQSSSSNQHMINNIPRSASSRLISKKTSRASCSSLQNTAKRNNCITPPSYS